MAVQVNLADLRRAFRRLLTRLPDEAGDVDGVVIFSADSSLGIVAGGTSEALSANVTHSGLASVLSSTFRGIARTLRLYQKTTISLAFRAGAITIDRTEFRHEHISV